MGSSAHGAGGSGGFGESGLPLTTVSVFTSSRLASRISPKMS
jgi:hypothetical protein